MKDKDPKIGTGKKPPNTRRRLYTDENPKDTIAVKYSTLEELKKTVSKLERVYKKGQYPHIRISQVGNLLEQRIRFLPKNTSRHNFIKRYVNFLKQRTKLKSERERKKLIFKL